MPAKSSYQFALVDQHHLLTGEHLIDIVDSWGGVERWWRERSQHRSEILIGYISYEQGYQFINAPRSSILWQKKSDSLKLPPVLFGRFRRGARFNLHAPKQISPAEITLQKHLSAVTYKKMFNAAQRHIRLGDIYQVNLSHRLTFQTNTPGENLFWQLFFQQPTPYSAFIQTPGYAILSYSPELFLRLRNQQIETRPMKGTCPRGKTPQQDKQLHQALFTSTKERAELDMIIDVHRNDLHQTACSGSVKVKRRRELVPYQTVWQAQSRIMSQLKRGYSPLDVITTCFPAGSITGAPKLRAMEIIHELEAVPRQVYCGAIGYLTAQGNMEFNVAIRSGIKQNKNFYYNVGSGITFDSGADQEWQETLDKAKIMQNGHNQIK